jgi:hypothetical protein
MQYWKVYLAKAFEEANINKNDSLPIVRESYRAMTKSGDVLNTDVKTEADKFAGRAGFVATIKNEEDKKALQEYWDVRTHAEVKAQIAWYEDLREENKHYNEGIFNLIYSRAYDRGHSSGYDAVAIEFDDIANFAYDILAAAK